MKIVPVKGLSMRIRENHKLQKLIKEFCDSDYRVARLDIDTNEYKTLKSAQNSLRVAVKRSKRPVKVTFRQNDIYLVKIL